MRALALRIALLALSAVSLGAGSAEALTLQPIGKFAQPTYVTSDPGDPDRLFVTERLGTIQLVEDGVASEFADLSSKVGCGGSCAGERGLMSIALAPDFDLSGRLFVDYVDDVEGTIHVDELRATGPDRERAEAATLRPVLAIPHPGQANHNGGQIQFGPDGFLYVSTGDGGGSNDELHNAQSLGNLLGKLLRIDPRPSGALPYTVPPATRSPPSRRRRTRSGASACATPSASPSTG
jgi:glucose/arabinose dehydrogenase